MFLFYSFDSFVTDKQNVAILLGTVQLHTHTHTHTHIYIYIYIYGILYKFLKNNLR
jgi:hypothetical protein